MHLFTVALPTYIGLVAGASIPAAVKSQLPIVDLGYVRQQAIAYNATASYYNFTNIAFAEPPLGNLRFSAPQPPNTISGAEPEWLTLATKYPGARSSPPGPEETEDCLYLDVFTPKAVFDQAWNRCGSPVLVWIYGGGDVIGSKAGFDPATLVTVGEQDTSSQGLVFVAMNYRLGAFGFLGGDLFTSQGGTANNGLLDQRLALQWVQQYISKFGDDPNRVTVMGESGGASGIIHQLTANSPSGQKLDVTFEQAVIQSPAELFINNSTQSDNLYQEFLKNIGASKLAEARKLSTKKLQSVNFKMVEPVEVGQLLFGPTVDGSFVRGQASNTLVNEGPNKNISIMTAHNSNEGHIFVPPPKNVFSPSFNFTTWVATVLSNASPQEVAYVANTLYPPAGAKTPWKIQFDRVNTFTGEAYVDCNEYGGQLAFNKTGYAYEFAVFPGVHVQDVYSTFYTGPNGDAPPINVTVATEMQKFFTNYAVSGNPNSAGLSPQMPIHGA